MHRRLFTAVLCLMLAACDSFLGGEEVARVPLQPAAGGGYAPVRFLLNPGMNAVAFVLHADFSWGKLDEAGHWNRYRVTLRDGDRIVASREVRINSPEKPHSTTTAPPSTLVEPLLQADVPAEAEYVLNIEALGESRVTLVSPQLALRIQVPRGWQ